MNTNFAGFVVLLAAIISGGCSRHFVVPDQPMPASCSSNAEIDGVRFSFDKWKGGLAIMFVDNVNGGVHANGVLDASTYKGHVSVRRADGAGYDWRLKTTDGESAELTINNVPYDLSKGTLFAVKLDGEKLVVHQLNRDLSHLDIDLAQCADFVNNSPEIIQLVAEHAHEPSPQRAAAQ